MTTMRGLCEDLNFGTVPYFAIICLNCEAYILEKINVFVMPFAMLPILWCWFWPSDAAFWPGVGTPDQAFAAVNGTDAFWAQNRRGWSLTAKLMMREQQSLLCDIFHIVSTPRGQG